MMKRILILSFILGVATLFPSAQVTSRSAFNTAPVTVLPTLPKQVRLDMVDYFESGSSKPSGNILDAPSRIVAMDDRKMEVAIGDDLTIDFCVLPYGKKQIIMVISSLRTPAVDSAVRFYDSQWNELNTDKLFRYPTLEKWTGKMGKADRLDLENSLPFLMTSISFEPADNTLTVTPDLNGYLSDIDEAAVRSRLRENIVYRWNGKKFVEKK